METQIRILIADDHPIFRKGLREVIEEDPSLIVISEVEDGAMALAELQSLAPRVAVLDIEMPKKNGFALAQAVRDLKISVEIIFLTMYKEEDAFNRALDTGVKGYVLKDSAATEIISGIKAVAAGQYYISPALSSFLVNRNARAALLDEEKPGLHRLTPVERRILRLIAEKRSSKEIAMAFPAPEAHLS
jgi:DNA-binding NarL/FixJ family response regulator